MNSNLNEKMREVERIARPASDACAHAAIKKAGNQYVATLAAIRTAGGMAGLMNLELHDAIDLFMTYYKDAEQHRRAKD